ncbi:MAG: hypothetical protein H6657_16125 [Ardenticatenaceae bacterium]|nr:hypothetical protein [Ardenticatenaceae bacterium]
MTKNTTPRNASQRLCLLLFLVLLAACTPKPVPTPPPPALPVSDAQTAPTVLKELSICMASEPDDLFLYGSTQLQAVAIRHALYENLYTTLDYDYQVQGLAKLPNLDDGDAVVNQVMVQAGDTVVDADGRITTLTAGTTLLDAEGTPFVFNGEPVELPQMVVDFTLKPMVWSDGTAVTAADSVFSYEVAAYYDATSQPITHTASYTAVDNHTVRWTGLPGWLDQTYFRNVWTPLPQHQLTHYEMAELANLFGPNPETPILSSGPFVVKEWIPGSDILLQANPYYYRHSEELPRLTQIEVKFILDTNSAVAQLISGACDILTRDVVDVSQLTFLLEAESAELMTTYTQVNAIFEHIAFGINSYGGYGDGNGRPDWFEDVRVRQAIAHCTDRQRMVDEILFGLSEVMNTYVPSVNPIYPVDIPQWPYDVAAANALLDAAGYRDTDGDGIREAPVTGTPFRVSLGTTADNEMRQHLTEIFKENLLACGIDVELSYLPASEWFADGPEGKLIGRQYDLAEYAWLAEMEPPCAYWLSDNISGPVAEGFAGWDGLNDTGWRNDEFDAACRQAQRAFRNGPEYVTAHQAAMRLFAEQLPTLPLFPRLQVAATAPYVRNFGLNPTQSSELWNVHELDMELPYDQAALASLEPAHFCAEVTEIPQDECEALVILFKEMKNYSWTRYYNWLNTPTPCAWVHVTCTENHVTGLFIQSDEPGNIPAEIGNLSYLENLRLWWPDLTELPPEIGRLTNLTDLDLFSSSLTSLPPEIGNLTNLINLNLSSNSLSSLPPEIGNLANLVTLDLSGNGLKNVPPELWRLHNLATLDLTGNSLTELPEGIDQLTNLTDLSLRGNSLGDLPPDLWKMTNLTTLDLAVMGLTNLPPEISNLTNLSDLTLSYNQLGSLPPEIGNLTSLSFLELYQNNLNSLPAEIGNLVNLHSLNLGQNNLTRLPLEIGNLRYLRWLDLPDNPLEVLPAELCAALPENISVHPSSLCNP